MKLKEKKKVMYKQLCETPSDIHEHLPVLAELAKDCQHITEMGVRSCVSSWAFIEGMNGGKLISIDIKHPSFYIHQGGDISFEKAVEVCKEKGIDFEFIEADTLKIKIEPTDLLFIDTLHTGEQLKQELKLHANKAKKFIIFHDTVSCADELMPVINDFLKQGKWKVKAEYKNNNGLLCLSRQSIQPVA